MISGTVLRDALISGTNNILRHKKEVDELNVFPVPDGDTGTNMSMTMSAGMNEIAKINGETVSEVSEVMAQALLRGARGNSGVILSLLFRGIAKGLNGLEAASGKDLARALTLGVEDAYKAVMHPVEGTILTVARVAAEKATELAEVRDNPEAVLSYMVENAKIALANTPEQLPVLKKAGVVDAGGKGLLLIFEGMLSSIKDGVIIEADSEDTTAQPSQKNAAAEYEGEITFTYCTEFIIERDLDSTKSPSDLKKYLENIGDSIVVADDDSIIKVHVHTDNPGRALQQGLKYGQLTNIKIENMRKQHEQAAKAAAKQKLERQEPVERYGFVAVATGQGIQSLFTDLGVNHIVSGGQTMNPSTKDILEAVLATPAKTVFVLPNNKNIILSAEQAASLADRKVMVLRTRTIPQGLSAMLAFDPDADEQQNYEDMTKAFQNVSTGQVTYSVRDSVLDSLKIKKGDILSLLNGRLIFTEKDPVKAAVRLTKSMIKKNTSFVTIIYGKDITAQQAQDAFEQIRQKTKKHVELTLIDGGQPVYYFIISVE